MTNGGNHIFLIATKLVDRFREDGLSGEATFRDSGLVWRLTVRVEGEAFDARLSTLDSAGFKRHWRLDPGLAWRALGEEDAA